MPILNSLAERQAATVAAVDGRNSERVRLSFLDRDMVDPDRTMIEIDAVLRVTAGDETNATGGFAQNWMSRFAAGRSELHIDRATYEGPKIRTRDRVQAISRPGMPWFDVLRVDDRGDTRLVLELGEI